jgi:hypothetical protein
MPNGLLDFFADPIEHAKIRQGFMDAVNRGAIGATLGAPVDMANSLLNLGKAGYGYVGNKTGLLSADQMPELIDNPVGGSEYIGNQMQRLGVVSPNRNALAEGLAGFLPMSPSTSAKAVAAIGAGGLVPGMEAAMLNTVNGKIPETLKETSDLARLLSKKAQSRGYLVDHSVSNVSPSQYVTFSRSSPDGMEALPDLQVRFSNHGDRYPMPDVTGTRFSVDPSTGNTYEQAIKWLNEQGVNVNKRLPKPQFRDDALIARIWGGPLETAPPAWVELMRKEPINRL